MAPGLFPVVMKQTRHLFVRLLFPVRDVDRARALIEEREWSIHVPVVDATVQPYGPLRLFAVKTPDGANIQFYAPAARAE
ncbi:MAG: hypothetical protein ACR2QV_10610 [Gammaproteobacteria bacterium]